MDEGARAKSAARTSDLDHRMEHRGGVRDVLRGQSSAGGDVYAARPPRHGALYHRALRHAWHKGARTCPLAFVQAERPSCVASAAGVPRVAPRVCRRGVPRVRRRQHSLRCAERAAVADVVRGVLAGDRMDVVAETNAFPGKARSPANHSGGASVAHAPGPGVYASGVAHRMRRLA